MLAWKIAPALAAGNTVAARIESGARRQVLIAEMRSGPLAIGRIRLFTEVC